MAITRIIFHWSDGTQFTDDLGCDFTILPALRKYTCDEKSALMQHLRPFKVTGNKDCILMRIHLQMKADLAPQGMEEIGGMLVREHLSSESKPNRIGIFLRDDENRLVNTNCSVEFI